MTQPRAGKLVYQQLPGGTKDYYVYQAKDSVAGLLNPSGNLVGGTTYAYDPYGTLTQGQTSTDNPWLFQGQYSLLEDQGSTWALYHMGARHYQPSIQRWTQPDPFSTDSGGSNYAGEVLNQNRYLFATDNPINQTDPSGRQCAALSVTSVLSGTALALAAFGGAIFFGEFSGATGLSSLFACGII